MTTKNPNWNYYKTFFDVLRLGSLSAAARQLGVRQSTIGRQIEALEEELGVVLFTRSQTGLKPTDAALRLRPHLETLANTAEALVRDAQLEDMGISGTIRITTSETVAIEILPQVLFELRSKFAHINFELSISDDFENLLAREADIAIRSSQPFQKAILTKKVGDIEMGLYASRKYLRGRKIPQSPDDLRDHALIGFDKENDRIRKVKKKIEFFDRSDYSYQTDNLTLHTKLIDAGCGVGFCLVDDANPQRVRILPKIFAARYDVWVAMHENLKSHRKYRAVFNELAAVLKIRLR